MSRLSFASGRNFNVIESQRLLVVSLNLECHENQNNILKRMLVRIDSLQGIQNIINYVDFPDVI